MARIRVQGHELLVKPLNKARNRDIIELQIQSGLKMTDIRDKVNEADHLGNVIASFLAQRNAGFSVRYADLLDGTFEDLGEFIEDPEDKQTESEDEEVANPPASRTSESDAEGGAVADVETTPTH